MRGRPRVTVIMAAYNVEKYIAKAITSALAQTVQDVEVIVVDDASSDRTAKVVQSIPDPRVRLLQNSLNLGQSFSRNVGIDHANGDWIAILDADDWWAPDRIEALLGIAEQEDVHILADDLFLIEDGTQVPWNTYFKSRERVIGRIDKITEVTPVKMIDDDYGILQPMIKYNFLVQQGIRYQEHLKFAEDYVFVLDCLLRGAKMLVCPEAYYYYRLRAGSLTHSELADTQAQYNVLLELTTKEPYNGVTDVVQALCARLDRLELALNEIRAIELFRQRNIVQAASMVISNPRLLISYARHIKRTLLPRR